MLSVVSSFILQILLLGCSNYHAWGLPTTNGDELECSVGSGSGDFVLSRNGLSQDSLNLWPNKEIFYELDDTFSESETFVIEEAINDFNGIFSGCFTWRRRNGELLHIKFVNKRGCHSFVGRAYWPLPLFQEIAVGSCALKPSHIKHEMMHAIGFYHEHSRLDRDKYVEILWQNIRENQQDQFEQYRGTSAFGEDYDYNSILHYTHIAWTRDSDTPLETIRPKREVFDRVSKFEDTMEHMGYASNFSDIDISKIKKLYRCSPYQNWKVDCSDDKQCAENEFCSSSAVPFSENKCQTKLADGFFCLSHNECLSEQCSWGVCISCIQDDDCSDVSATTNLDHLSVLRQICKNAGIPFATKQCSSDKCGQICLTNSDCEEAGGRLSVNNANVEKDENETTTKMCDRCSWSFMCTPS